MKFVFFVLFLFVNLQAEILFDLQDQFFENAHKQSTQASIYELPKVKVSTINLYQTFGGEYVTPPKEAGIIAVKLKKEIKYFNVSFKAKFRSTYDSKTPSIVLKSDTGVEFVISLDKQQLVIQNKVFSIGELHKKTLHVNMEKIDDVIVTSVNGQVFYNVEIQELSNLKRVEMIINNSTGSSTQDLIYDLVVSSK